MISAPTPLPMTETAAPTPTPKTNLKTKGTIFDVSGNTYTNREKLSTNYLKDKILGSAEVYDTGEPEPAAAVAAPAAPVKKASSSSSSFFSNAVDTSSKSKAGDLAGHEITANVVDEEASDLPALPVKTHSSIQSLDDIGGRRRSLRTSTLGM